MKTSLLAVWAVVAAAGFASVPAWGWQPEAAVVEAHAPSEWLRVVESDEKQTLTLEVASREYGNSRGQTVSLVGAVHIGDKKYYDALQTYLDSMDLVLWEGVKPEAALANASWSEEKRIAVTKARLRLLAGVVERHKSAHARKYPTSLDAVVAESEQKAQIEQLRQDGWGNPVQLVYGSGPSKRSDAKPGTMVKTMDLVSLGGDGQKGGEGAAADLKLSQPPLSASERAGKDAGIQVQLAKALGLEFQLTSIDYDRGHWRNSDMSAEALQQRMVETGQSLDSFMGMLDGSSGMAQVAGLLMRMVGSSPRMQTTVKVMMLYTLSQASDMSAVSRAAGMGDFMKVILDDRNAVVMKDLAGVLEEKPDAKLIGVFYGAGHFGGMEKTLVDEMKFTPGRQVWFPAVVVDLKAAGMSMGEARKMKNMMQGMMRDMRQVQPADAE